MTKTVIGASGRSIVIKWRRFVVTRIILPPKERVMKLWRESLKFKVAAAIAAMLVLVLGVGTWINLSLFSDEYLAWSQARAEVVAKPLIQRIQDLLSQVGDNPSAFIVLSGDIHLLMKENPEVSRVAIFDRSGKLATDSDKDANKNLDANARIQRIIETTPHGSVTLAVGGNYYALIPIKHDKATLYAALLSPQRVPQVCRLSM